MWKPRLHSTEIFSPWFPAERIEEHKGERLVHFNYSGTKQKDQQGKTNFKSIVISCTSLTSKHTSPFGKYIIKPEPIFSLHCCHYTEKNYHEFTQCDTEVADWNLNPKQIVFLPLNKKHKNEVIFISQLENDNMKENIETIAASQYDPRQDKFLHKVLHVESFLYEGFCS